MYILSFQNANFLWNFHRNGQRRILDIKECLLFHPFFPGLDFIKVGRTAQIIEIALLKLGAWRKAHSKPLKASQKLGIGSKTVYEIDPWASCSKYVFLLMGRANGQLLTAHLQISWLLGLRPQSLLALDCLPARCLMISWYSSKVSDMNTLVDS